MEIQKYLSYDFFNFSTFEVKEILLINFTEIWEQYRNNGNFEKRSDGDADFDENGFLLSRRRHETNKGCCEEDEHYAR